MNLQNVQLSLSLAYLLATGLYGLFLIGNLFFVLLQRSFDLLLLLLHDGLDVLLLRVSLLFQIREFLRHAVAALIEGSQILPAKPSQDLVFASHSLW
ncbi:MAG TPA: hypothetical protein VHV08_17925, partial [Pirellulales bacterium]|nr:hypothetical protein [Pirellulales bacterium]